MTNEKAEMNIDQEIIEDGMDDVLAVLHTISDSSIPAALERRLSAAFKEEGERIRSDRQRLVKTRRYIKAAAALAACFVVVFASVTVYNNGMIPLSKLGGGADSFQEEISMDEATAEAMDVGSDIKAPALKKQVEEDNIYTRGIGSDDQAAYSGCEDDCSPNQNGEISDVDKSANSAIFGKKEEEKQSYDESGLDLQSMKTDVLSRESSQCLLATKELQEYIRLADQYLSNYDYEIITCERNSETGGYIFTVLIVDDPSGEKINDTLVLFGESGEIYEQQSEEPKTGSD